MNKFKINLLIIFFGSLLTAQSQNTTPVWISITQGNGDNSDRYNNIVPDGSGNYIAVGYSIRSGNYRDFLVVKLDANGDTLWTHTKNGKGSGDDEAVSAVVDASGNVFVCGYSDGGVTNLDILLIKYDQNGTKLFDTTWNSPSYLDDIPVAMAMDASGNIIIGGNAKPEDVTGSNDYITLKFAPNGSLAWATEFSRSGVISGKDELAGLVVDGSGDVYVTGRSSNGVDDDFATIKYSGVDGTQSWLQVYNSGNGNDRGAAIALDNSGGVIVTGRSKNSSNDDFRTVKYSQGGVLQWSKFYNAPANQDDRALAITVDASDNVYVTGQSDVDNSSTINYDFATVKYNSAGTQQWSKITGSIYIQDDIPTAIKADASGNIYITGKSDQDPGTPSDNDWMTVSYNTGGTLLWTQFKGGNNTGKGDTPGTIILDGSNCLVVGSLENTTTQKDATVVKYDAAGNELFAKSYNGLGDFNENSKAVVIDSNDFGYTAGYSFVQDHNRDATIIQTDPGGTRICSYMYNGAKNDDDEFNDLALSPNGRIYGVGYTKVSGQKSNFLLVKYDPTTCDTLWTRTYDYIGQSDKADGVVVDVTGNIYITGRSDSNPVDSIDNNDIVTIKYDSNGNMLWTQRFNGSGNLRDEPSKILLNGLGEVLVSGRTENIHDDDFLIIKYDATTGNPIWATPIIYGGPFANDDRPTDMTIDANNNIFICGYSQTGSTPSNEDPVVLKYDNSGNLMSFYSYSAVGNDEAAAIGHDPSGNIFVVFKTDVDPDPLVSNFDILTIKFDNDLSQLWLSPPQYDSPINQDDVPIDLLVTAQGDVYVTGTTENDSTGGRINQNWLTIFYSSLGNQIAIANYDGPNATDDAPNGIAIRGNSFWVCGYVEGQLNAQKDADLLRYNLLVGINNPSEVQNSNAYPNPFNLETTIKFNNETNQNCIFTLTDLTGSIVRSTKFSGNKIKVEKGNLSSGMYQYSISGNSNILTRGKLVIN